MQKKLRPDYELPEAEYRLVQLIKNRLGYIASISLTCFLFGETPRLMGISPGETDMIERYAAASGVSLTDRGHQCAAA